MPDLHELPDGSLAAFFDADGEMTDDEDKAVTVIVHKPDGSMIYGSRAQPEETPNGERTQ